MIYSIDGGLTWHSCTEIRIDPLVFSEEDDSLTMVCTTEGVIVDLWKGPDHECVGSSCEGWEDIAARLT